jgi:uncharacterized membrane protein YdbT with pleckstrin-like domain
MDEVTTPGEQELWSGSVSHWHYIGRWLLFLLLLAGLVATFVLQMPAQPSTWTIQGALGLLALVILSWILIDRSRRRYTITNRRVSAEFGIISKSSKEMRVEDIRSINLSTTGFAGLLGIGRVEFSAASSGEDDVVFWNVSGAQGIRDKVRGLQAQA